jgi:hypothetical protein
LDKAHLERMAAINRKLDVGPRGLTDKNRALLRQFDDPANVAALLWLPQKLIGTAGRTRNRGAAALLAQIAVAIEILTMAPLAKGAT